MLKFDFKYVATIIAISFLSKILIQGRNFAILHKDSIPNLLTVLSRFKREKAINYLNSNKKNVAISAIQINVDGNLLPYFRTQNEIRKQLFILRHGFRRK